MFVARNLRTEKKHRKDSAGCVLPSSIIGYSKPYAMRRK